LLRWHTRHRYRLSPSDDPSLSGERATIVIVISHRYRVDVSPDGPNHYLLRVPELDGTNGAGEVTGQCEKLDDLEYDAESLVAATLDSYPDAIQVEIRWDTSKRAVEICRDRVIRASVLRTQIGELWSEYIDRVPRRFAVEPADTPDTWTLVLRTLEPMPTRLSTLFGEWLYELRAALDGILYYVAVRDSGQNPPPAERGLMFPIFVDPAKFDDPSHRGRLQAVSDATFGLLRHVQPFNAQPDHLSNVLWWLDELARIDRHRYGHALAPHIDRVRIGVREPLTITRNFMPQPPKPVPVDESAPLPFVELQAPPGWDIREVQQHLEISDAASSFLDVTEWGARSSAPMNVRDLSKRMGLCEEQVLFGIVEPLATGNINLQPGPAGGSTT
jgi:hypothetical protein